MRKSSDETARSESQRSLLTQLGSVLALAISVVALATSAYQTRIMQQQARASVWPYLFIGASYFDEGDKAGFRLKVNNHGVGPARIESVHMRIDDKPILNWDGFLKAVLGHPRDTMKNVIFSNFGAVLPPDSNRETTIDAITLTNPQDAATAYAALDRLKVDICYCSVYDDCWTAHLFTKTVDPVAYCPVSGRNAFEE